MTNDVDNTNNPKDLTIQFFSGTDNIFTLYDDDGTTMNHENRECAKAALKFINGITAMDMDRNLYNAIVETVSTNGDF